MASDNTFNPILHESEDKIDTEPMMEECHCNSSDESDFYIMNGKRSKLCRFCHCKLEVERKAKKRLQQQK